MQDLSRYQKKDHIEIQTRYVSLLLAGTVALVGLVFALGVLVGSGQNAEGRVCEPADPLAALDAESGEPAPPEAGHLPLRSYHESLVSAPSPVPTPASLAAEELSAGDAASGGEAGEGVASGGGEAPALEEPRHEEEAVPERVPDADPGVYSLQVASFQDQSEATEMVRKLERAGHKSFLVGVTMEDRGR